MYIELIREVLLAAVKQHARRTRRADKEVLKQIREHIDATEKEYQRREPDINYQAPLCRLGYLYRYAAAHATLFEVVLRQSPDLQAALRKAAGRNLHICSVGGGPGTELLGIAKHLLGEGPRWVPRKITFTVLDNVQQWAETWDDLADAAEGELREAFKGAGVEPPTVAPAFLQLDVVERESYKDYAFKFAKADIFVFNHLLSENKAYLKQAEGAVKYLVESAPPGCVFVVIDRREHSPKFTNDVVGLFTKAGFDEPDVETFDRWLDSDEQIEDIGKLLTEILGRPRAKFFTPLNRDPTVFWFTVVKGDEA